MSQVVTIEMDLPGVVLSSLEDGSAIRRQELTLDLGQARLVQTDLSALQDYFLTLHTSPGTLIPMTLITEEDFEALEDKDPDRLYIVYHENADGTSDVPSE